MANLKQENSEIEFVSPNDIQQEYTRYVKVSCDPVKDPYVYYKTLVSNDSSTTSTTSSIGFAEPQVPGFPSARNFIPPRYTVSNPSPFVKQNVKNDLRIKSIPRRAKRGRPKETSPAPRKRTNL